MPSTPAHADASQLPIHTSAPTLVCLLDTFSWTFNRYPLVVPPTGFHFSLFAPTGTLSSSCPSQMSVRHWPSLTLPAKSGTRSHSFYFFTSSQIHSLSILVQVFIICHVDYYCSNILIDFLAPSLISLNLLSYCMLEPGNVLLCEPVTSFNDFIPSLGWNLQPRTQCLVSFLTWLFLMAPTHPTSWPHLWTFLTICFPEILCTLFPCVFIHMLLSLSKIS